MGKPTTIERKVTKYGRKKRRNVQNLKQFRGKKVNWQIVYNRLVILSKFSCNRTA